MSMSDRRGVAVSITARETAELVRVEHDSRPLGPQEVVGRTLATLISAGTELAGAYQGPTFPKFPGYAAAFEVEEVGSEVEGLRPGDLAYCSGPHRSFQRVEARNCLRAPAGLSPEEVTFCRLMGVTMSTLTTTRARPPDRVVVTGLGLVGHLGARVFAHCGYEVTACDPSPRRREIATQAGLSDVRATVPVEDPEFQGKVALVLECSGHEQAALDGCRVVRKRGEVALVGCPWTRKTDIPAQEILYAVFHRYVDLRSGWEWELPLHPTEFRAGSIFGHYALALRWIAEGSIPVTNLYTRVSPRDAQQAYQDLLHGRVETLGLVFDWRTL